MKYLKKGGFRRADQIKHDRRGAAGQLHHLNGRSHIQTRHAGGTDADLRLNTLNQIPRPCFFERLGGMLYIGAAVIIQACFATGAGEVVFLASVAVLATGVGVEMPPAQVAESFFAAAISACLAMYFWKNSSPSG